MSSLLGISANSYFSFKQWWVSKTESFNFRKIVSAAAAAAAKSFKSCLTVRPHRREPARLPCPWDSPGKNTGVGCHFLLQCMKVKSESEVAQSCPTHSDPMDCSPPGSSVHVIFQARLQEWVAIAFSENSFYVAIILVRIKIIIA